MNINKKYIDANKDAWNEAFNYHESAKGEEWLDSFSCTGYTVFSSFEKKVYSKLDLKGKSIVQVPCNNGREIISFLNLGAKYGAGIDISESNISFAKKLKDVSNVNARFYTKNVYEVGELKLGKFDIGIISVGSFNWMPDLKSYLEVYSELLKENGELFIFEMHPLTTVFPYSFKEDQKINFEDSYFNRTPYKSNQGLDYYGQVEYRSKDKYEFQHTLSDIIQTSIDLGFQIIEFQEYSTDIGGGHEYLELKESVPLSYHLWLKKL